MTHEQRVEKIKNAPEGTMFYCTNGYVGNSPYFWAEGHKGYTTNISKAHRFTKTEALEILANERKQDVFYIATALDAIAYPTVDMQYIQSADRI